MADTFDIRMYYSPGNDTAPFSGRLSPCPKFNIETRLQYANDNIIGYDYIITLNGYATAIDIVNDESTNTGLSFVAQRIDELRTIFGVNGGILRITDKNDNPLIVAKGGVVRNISFAQSDNFWVNYTPYTVEIVFNEIEYTACAGLSEPASTETFGCNGTSKHLLSSGIYSDSLIDLDLYKIESFQDQWSFNLDNTIYNTYDEFENQHFILEYKINAVGKTYFKDNKVLPSWEMAKNFCQTKLYNFITVLMKGVLNKSNQTGDGCDATKNLENLHLPSNKVTGSGILELDISTYAIFNETVSCETSQTDGSFGLTYSSIVKKINNSSELATNEALHTFSINKSITNDNANKITTISIQGNIQGLMPGGIINSPNVIQLPNQGTIFIHNNPTENTETKYNYALTAYNKIANSRDLKDEFKEKLGIKNSAFGLTYNPDIYPKCINHSVSHSYAEGTITYNTEFNSRMASIESSSIRNVVITQNDPTPRIAEFVIPGRSFGPIIQRVGSDEPRTISIRMEGVNSDLKCCFSPDLIINEIYNSGIHRYLPPDLPSEQITNLILTQDTYNANPLDGSFSVQREYICCDANVMLPLG